MFGYNASKAGITCSSKIAASPSLYVCQNVNVSISDSSFSSLLQADNDNPITNKAEKIKNLLNNFIIYFPPSNFYGLIPLSNKL